MPRNFFYIINCFSKFNVILGAQRYKSEKCICFNSLKH